MSYAGGTEVVPQKIKIFVDSLRNNGQGTSGRLLVSTDDVWAEMVDRTPGLKPLPS